MDAARILRFLNNLEKNNNKEWFEANKKEYLEVKRDFEEFVAKLIDRVSAFDQSVKGITVKDCVYRIYRDTRFSNNKNPYKSHFAAYICPNGKKSGYAGYYFHIEAKDSNYIGSHVLAAGIYMPPTPVLTSVREDLFDNTDEFMNALKKAKYFKLDMSDSLKRMPKGFPEDFKYADYLKLKHFSLIHSMTDEFVLSPDLLDKCTEMFKTACEFNHIINRAIEYTHENSK